jgi:predicted nuclease of restriction endonuclease-like RecB superfamily
LKKKPKTRNKFEFKLHTQLKKSKVKFEYEPEKIPYVLSGHYIPDFVLTGKNGKTYIEAKGHFRPEAKRKMVAVKKLHPAMDIRIVFYSFKSKDVRWAEKNRFPYAIGTIPKDWLENETRTS